jgi:hypothetical protein
MRKLYLRSGLFLLAVLASGSGLFALNRCDNMDFRGTYSLIASGAVTVPDTPITGPFGRAGQAVADGKGNVSFFTTASYNGNIFGGSFVGTYQVSNDCTMEFQLGPFEPVGLPAVFKAVIADNKQEVRFMISDPPGQTIQATLQKQSRNHCGPEDLFGGYVVDFTGSIVTPPLGAFVRVGRLVANGRGKFSADTTANYNGFAIQPESFDGTYTIGNDCTLVMQYGTPSGPVTWRGSLTDNSKGAVLIVSDPPGAAIVGTLKRQ